MTNKEKDIPDIKQQVRELLSEDHTLTVQELCELVDVPYSLIQYWINRPLDTSERHKLRSEFIQDCLIYYKTLGLTQMEQFMHISKGSVMQELRRLYQLRILPTIDAKVSSDRYGEGIVLNVTPIIHRGRQDHKVEVNFTDPNIKKPKEFIFGMGLLKLETGKGSRYDDVQEQLLMRVARSSDDIDWESPVFVKSHQKKITKDNISTPSYRTRRRKVQKSHPARKPLLEYAKNNPNVTVQDLARRFDVSHTSVRNWLSIADITIHSEFFYEKQKNKNNQTVSTNKESNEIIELRQTLEHLNDKVTELTEIKQSVSKRKSPIKAVASIRLRIPFYIKRK